VFASLPSTEIALACILLGGCALFQGAAPDVSPRDGGSDPAASGGELPAPASVLREAAPAASSIGPGDVVEVRVFQEADLSGIVRVSAENTIEFPLCGSITVGGSTAPEVADRIQKCLGGGYLKNPQVSVFIKEYNSKKVFVLGEVAKPGTFTDEDGLTIIQAITLAGGFKEYAGKNSTSITRLVNGRDQKIPVPVEDIGVGKSPNVLLQPGDIVYVPWSSFGY
jgi:protein involved in polysaccharide export with SLBB domain